MAEGMAEFEAALAALVARVEVGAERAAQDAAHVVEAAAKKNAPVVTGTLRRSIISSPGGSGEIAYQVGPTVIYGRRIELGFQGPDSLGRVYNQQPDPYLAPAVHESIPGISRVIKRRISEAIRIR